MGSLFRSEDMSICQLFLQAESAYTCISELGELGIVQFKDLNVNVNVFQRKFVNELRRCEEMERQLRFFEAELKKEDMEIADLMANPEAPAPRDMVDLEATYENLESELKSLNSSMEALRRNQLELKELLYVLRHTEGFFQEAACGEIELNRFGDMGDIEQGPPEPGQSRFYLGYVAGVISRERLPGFIRLLWFACRGNIFLKHAEIDQCLIDPVTGERVWKEVFIAFFQGEQLKARVKKICEGYKATIYPCSENQEERNEVADGVLSRLKDLQTVIQKSVEQKQRILSTVAQNWKSWTVKVLKIKAIYHTMSKCQTEGNNYIAECFVPSNEIDTVQLLLNRATEHAGSTVPCVVHPIVSQETLPTYNKTNKFTEAFQSIIDAYGVANYKEVNPAPFTLITFPFLFSVMFGDFGHGIVMFLFALWMVVRETQLYAAARDGEMFGMIYSGRYILLLMGGFSMYAGIMYNDTFSKSFCIFRSSWDANVYNDDNVTLNWNIPYQLNPNDSNAWSGVPYVFGVDPVWQLSLNKISFTNSYKKKISVILGFTQMIVGLFLSLFNHVYFKRYLNIFCNFIPQLLFLLSIFGYMVSLLFVKWVMFDANGSFCAPNILIGFINMFLFSYKDDDPQEICSNKTWYNGQQIVQKCLVILALVCALWMLFTKPLIQYFRHRAAPTVPRGRSTFTDDDVPLIQDVVHVQINSGYLNADGSSEQTSSDTEPIVLSEEVSTPEYDFGDEFIKEAIHTIEYCLNCISHTASYLRLWALSLAHSQLSEVLWNMVMRPAFQLNGYLGVPMLVVVFPPFAFLTVAILLVMEGLSAFLHTLRLHWVEFQSKFYEGDGIPFLPFSFNEILKEGFE